MKYYCAYLLLSGASRVTSSSLRRAQQETSCLLEVDMIWTSTCTGSSVLSDIATQIEYLDSGCTHNKNVEAALLTDFPGDLASAKQALITECVSAREPCLGAAAFEAIQYSSTCTGGSVLMDITTALTSDGGYNCPHNRNIEAQLLTGATGLTLAKAALIDKCVSARKPCLDAAAFEAIQYTSTCTGGSVLTDITTALTSDDGYNCPHNRNIEAQLLTGATDLTLAKAALIDKCVSAREPCLDAAAFEAIEYVNCTQSTILDTLQQKLESPEVDCPHNRMVEAQLLTKEAASADAINILKGICVLTLEKCLPPLPDLVLQTESCSHADITTELTSMLVTEECGHDFNQEVLLMTGMDSVGDAKRTIRNTCLSNLAPCSFLANADIEINLCNTNAVVQSIKNDMKEDCEHSLERELIILTGTLTRADAENYIYEMCNLVWDAVESTQFEDIDATNFQATDFITDYFQGGTFLNTETSNFQLNDDGTNPTGEYTISQRTLDVGANIDAFHEDEAESTIMDSTVDKLNTCQNQVMMCCFGRDRQSGDDNGDCAAADDGGCEDANPNDNSDLCSADGISYPGDSEGDIHCHGVAWAESKNDPTNRLRFNNLFYVSMYDHMYTRGYVQNALAPASSNIPMCSCIEDMPIVSRADCTQVDVDLTVALSFDGVTGLLTAAHQDDLNVAFNACQASQNNDLGAYVQKLANRGKISAETLANIDQVIVDECTE